jgi:molybdenum cofactor cytidylyltransferase
MPATKERRQQRKRRAEAIHPIILAAGRPGELPFPKALAAFGAKLALERAIETCAAMPGLARPIVVLGCSASRVLAGWKKTLRANSPVRVNTRLPAPIARNVRWRRGQLTSLVAGLSWVPRGAAFMIYPVDYPLISPALLAALIKAYRRREPQHQIVMPAIGRRAGHPVIVAPGLRAEFYGARTARDVIYRNGHRVLLLRVRDSAIFRDFDSLASYRLCLRLLRRRGLL